MNLNEPSPPLAPATRASSARLEGPAIVSVIAVLSKNGEVAQVLQWSRIAMLPEGPDPLVDTASEAGQGEAT